MDRFIEQLDFRKIFIGYIIFAFLAAVGFGGAAAGLNWDKISFAAQYIAAGLELNVGERPSAQIEKMSEISLCSESVPDIFILKNDNTVVFSTNPELAEEGDRFILDRSASGFLEYEGGNGAVYKAVDKSDFILASLLPVDLTDISEQYRDEYFFEQDFKADALHLISYMGSDTEGNKICIVSPAASMGAGISSVKAAAATAVFVFMVYWLLAAMWIYQNALRAGLAAPLWGIAVLLTNAVGIVIYELYKHSNAICPYCGSVQEHGGMFCVRCGKRLAEVCVNCGGKVGKNDKFCRRCGRKTGNSKEE